MLASADVALAEPVDLDDEAYTAWALGVCRAHGVRVVVVGARAAALSRAAERFRRIGAELIVPPAAGIEAVEDKAAAYAAAAAIGVPVPPHEVVRDGAGLLAAWDRLVVEGEVCVKPVRGAGGDGFRVLHDEAPSGLDLQGPPLPRLHVRTAAEALDAAPESGPLLVMPVLPGPEVSVDCLADRDGEPLIAVARRKDEHHRLVVDDPAAVAIAQDLVRLHALAYLSNTQVRYWRRPGVDAVARPYLLETNSRPAAGSYQSAAVGVDLITAAVRLALGLPLGLPVRVPEADLIVLPAVLTRAHAGA